LPVKVLTEVDEVMTERLWHLYQKTFAPLATRAALRHTLLREEFVGQMRDERVWKYVAMDDQGTPAGLATMTCDLSTVPDVSPDYYTSRWPDAHAEGRLFYLGYLIVHPRYQDTETFNELILATVGTVAQAGGVLGFDMCRFNQEHRRLITRMIDAVGREDVEDLKAVDVQTFYAVTFSDTAGSVPAEFRPAAGSGRP
jgi:hypothetical protein